MHKLIITRRLSTDYGTPARAILDDGWEFDTLELPWRGNAKGLSCIKAGTYRAWLWWSPHLHRWVYRLEDKHGRGDCLIHNGNLAGDVTIDRNHDGVPDLKTQVHGCTETGQGYGEIGGQFGILNSVKVLEQLITACGGALDLPNDSKQPESTNLEITYVWEDGAQPEDDI